MSVLLTILKLGQIVGTLVEPDLEAALKIKGMFHNLSPEYQVNVNQLTGFADAANQDTIAKVNDWLKANGYDPLPDLPAPATAGGV